MRRFRSRRSTGRSSRPMRNREWVGFSSTTDDNGYYQPRTNILTPGQTLASWVIDPNTARDRWDEPTIARIILFPEILLSASPAEATAEFRQTFRGGFITWKGTSVAGGGPATELDGIDPEDPGADWLWWTESHFSHFNLLAFGINFHDFTGGDAGYVNIKAKRKLELGYGLAGCFTNVADSSPGSPVGIEYHFAGRILLLNH